MLAVIGVVGTGILAFLLAYLGINLDPRKHGMLQFMFIAMALAVAAMDVFFMFELSQMSTMTMQKIVEFPTNNTSVAFDHAPVMFVNDFYNYTMHNHDQPTDPDDSHRQDISPRYFDYNSTHIRLTSDGIVGAGRYYVSYDFMYAYGVSNILLMVFFALLILLAFFIGYSLLTYFWNMFVSIKEKGRG